jgi:hypothetical protein
MGKEIMKTILKSVFVILALAMLSGCAITNKYGPYMGKVVDKETNEPIDGAVVFMRFYTEGMYSVSQFENAVEFLSDKNGEFKIPPQRIVTFKILSWWDERPSVIIFKPGYGAYPGHQDSSISRKNWGASPDKEPVTVTLPRLKTRKERKDNLGNLWAGSGVPQEKYKILNTMKSKERTEIGLKP